MIPISVSFIILTKNNLSFNVGGDYYIIDYSYSTYVDWASWHLYVKKEYENTFGGHAGFEYDIPIYKNLSFNINTKGLILKPILKTTQTGTSINYSGYNSVFVIKQTIATDLSSVALAGGLRFKF